MSQPFICPHCRKECPTLRDLLTCHPRELRAHAAELDSATHYNLSLAGLLAGRALPPMFRARVAERLDPTSEERAA